MENQPENLSNDGLVKMLTDGTSDTILSKEYVQKDGLSYARAVTKDEDGYISENRAYRKGDKIFEVMLTIKNEADFHNQVKYKSYKDLLDSFVADFDRQDRAVKDLSNVENGYRWFEHKDFGLKVKVPAEWEKNSDSDASLFYNEDGDQWLKITVTSAAENEQLDDWVANYEKVYRERFNEKFIEVDPNVVTSTIAGVPARERNYVTSDGAQKYPEHDIYLIKGKYKFYFEIGYDKNESAAKTQERLTTISRSISIDEQKMNQSLGFIQDDTLIDRDKVATIKDSKYKYAIDIPEYWSEGRFNNQEVSGKTYNFEGGTFTLMVFTERFSDVVKGFSSVFELQADKSSKFTVVENKSVKIFGETGQKYLIRAEESNMKYEQVGYIVQKGKYTYLIGWMLNDAYKTEPTQQRLERVLNSFKALE